MRRKQYSSRKSLINRNHHYFNKWSSNMAYILGFITADGFIQNKNFDKRLCIEIKDSDIEILEFIRDEISPSSKIILIERLDKRTNKVYKTCKIRISSPIIIDDLEKLKIKPQKTGNEQLPEIPEEFKWDYLRGLFDGDGHISIKYYKKSIYGHFGITMASKEFLEDILSLMNINGVIQVKNKTNCYRLAINKNKDLLQIKNNFYNGNFALKRKMNKFNLIKELI